MEEDKLNESELVATGPSRCLLRRFFEYLGELNDCKRNLVKW
jgi:hypothetical protein